MKIVIFSLLVLTACNLKSKGPQVFKQVQGDLEVVNFITSQGQARFIVELKVNDKKIPCYIPALQYFNSFQHTSALPLKAAFSGVVLEEGSEVKSIELRSINEENTILINCVP